MTFARTTVAAATLFVACQAQPMKVEIDGETSVAFHSPKESRTITVAVLDREGNVIEDPKLRWYVIDEAIASVDKSGKITPLKDGETRVVVRSGYAQREVPVEIRFYGKIVPSTPSLTVGLGELTQLSAEVFDTHGVSVSGAEVAWTTSNPDVADIDEDGALVGVGVGKTSAIVRAGDVETKVAVEIVSPGHLPAT